MSPQGTGSDHKEPKPLAVQGFLLPWIPLVLVTSGIGVDVVASSPMILGMLDHLQIELPLGVWGLGVELAFKVYSRHRVIPERLQDS